MAAGAGQHARATTKEGNLWLALAVLIFAGFNLRTVLLEVPPILPLIEHDLRLNHTEIGLLNALPLLLLGGLAYPASWLIGRIGARWSMSWALAAITVTALLRSVTPNATGLFLMTALLSVAIALGQTSVPLTVHEWFGRHIGQATAAYSTGLMVGEIVAAAFTAPLLLQTVAGGSWRGTFIFWAIPVLIALLLWLFCVPPRPNVSESDAAPALLAPDAAVIAEEVDRQASGDTASAAKAFGGIGVWRVLQVSLILGCGSLLFFALDTWIPVYYVRALHRTDSTLALAALTIAQLPASLALTAWGQHFAGRRIGFVIAGALASVAMLLWFVAPPSWYLALIAVTGAASAAIFVLGMSMPSLIARGKSVAQISGFMLTISYTMAFIGPFLGGVLWDNTGIAITAFLPILLASIGVLCLGAFMPDVKK